MGNSLVVQWLGLHAGTAKGLGSIPGLGTKIPEVTQSGPPPKKRVGEVQKKNKTSCSKWNILNIIYTKHLKSYSYKLAYLTW